MMKTGIFLLLTAAVVLGCSSEPKSAESTEKYKGREETKKLQGADAAGYDGTAVRKSVDNALDKNDEHNSRLDKAGTAEAGK
jgi:hypothetical protein